jgi:hypothetical protein
MKTRTEVGFSLAELVVSTAVVLLLMGGAAGMLVQNSRAYRSGQMKTEVQARARTTMSIITNALWSCGWDPRGVGFAAVVVDPAPTNTTNFLQIRSDIDEDGTVANEPDEDITIRWSGGHVEWRRTSDTTEPFQVIADNITNDENGDGTAEQMFTADSISSPRRITVKITAQSPVPDPQTNQFARCTLSTQFFLRNGS